MIEFAIPYPTTPKGKAAWNRQYGFNAYWAGKHWAKRKADADYWHALTRQAVKGLPPLTEYPVIITMYFSDRMDSINHAAICLRVGDILSRRGFHPSGDKKIRKNLKKFCKTP